MSKTQPDKKNGIATVAKLLQILECFSIEESELSAQQIGERLGIPMPTLYRYLQTMVNEDFLVHDPATNGYYLGLQVVSMAGVALTRYEVKRVGQQPLDQLAQQLDLNANMAILQDIDIFHLAFSIRNNHDPWYGIVGRRSPANLTAMGKVLLAHRPFHWVRARIEEIGWRARTANSISDFDLLEAEFAEIRKTDFALDRQELSTPFCLACPVRQRDGAVIAAISATAKPAFFHDHAEEMYKGVFETAATISYKMGYLGNCYLDIQTSWVDADVHSMLEEQIRFLADYRKGR